MNEQEYNRWLDVVVKPVTTAREYELAELMVRVAKAKGLTFWRPKEGGFVHIRPKPDKPFRLAVQVLNPHPGAVESNPDYEWPYRIEIAWRLLNEGGFTDYEIEKTGGLFHCTIEAAWHGEGQTPAEAICRAWLEWERDAAMAGMMP